MDLTIARAGEADVAELGIIGPAAYAAAYHDYWDDAVGFARHVTSFGPEAMRTFLARPDTRTWIARQDGVGVGFLTLVMGALEPIGNRPNGAEIPRIYLLPGARRGGIGRKLRLCVARRHGGSRVGAGGLCALGVQRHRRAGFFRRTAAGPQPRDARHGQRAEIETGRSGGN
jgi:diamine N-acetyltransferase